MRLMEFQVENYRSFRHRQRVELRPLTLFFGWNSGGKSALLRFLPLLAESVRARKVLELGGLVARGATWRDMVCRQHKHPKLSFSLSWCHEAMTATESWTINGEFDGRSIGVDRLKGTNNTGSTFEWTAAEHPGIEPDELSLALAPPSFLSEAQRTQRDALLQDGIDWITGIRIPPPRIYSFAGTRPKRLRPDGSNAIDYVLFRQESGRVTPPIEELEAFFKPLGLHCQAEDVAESIFRLTLTPLNTPAARVNLLDTGEGYAQVLPVLVALAQTRQQNRILCLEQPELHLHTHAQTVLAERLIAAANVKPSLEEQSLILVETHSEVVLASVQLAIARGTIPPERVRIYWVESTSDGTSQLFPVDFDVLGRPTSPIIVDAFAQAIRLGDELIKVRRGKRA